MFITAYIAYETILSYFKYHIISNSLVWFKCMMLTLIFILQSVKLLRLLKKN